MSQPDLLIIGASVRAAAFSAARAGFAPIAIDLFADRDLAERFPAHQIPLQHYPEGIGKLAETLPRCPFLFTGAIENEIGLIERLSLTRTCLASAPRMIERARQFGQFGLPAECPGVKFPETRQVGDGLPTDPSEAWLVKPIRSGGGLGVRAWRADETAIPAGHQLQRQINGRVVGLSYLGKGNSARYLGAIVAFQDASFHYAGGYGPLPETGLTEVFERLGTVITGNNPLRGLFGIDVILGDFDPATGLPQVWFLELNPRYTSSMELLEESLGISLMAEHARVFGIEVDGPEPSKGAALVAKQILYADRPAIVPDDIPWRVATGVPIEVADIPQQGTILAVGDPILTVFARGATEAELFDQLDRRAASWRARIAGWPATRSES